ncbi:MAG: hypothetical protein DME26_03270 [Verrucomicrobia bacterium]|nr:MAG: hypothetical protein DME26_03270 [Verrucomicrobiota bacterium]
MVIATASHYTFGIIDKLLFDRIKLQLRPNAERGFFGINANGFRVGQRRHHAVADNRVITEVFWLLERPFFGKAIRDVCQMAKRCRKMALLNLGSELLSFAAAHGTDEIRKVIAGFWPVEINLYQFLALAFAF